VPPTVFDPDVVDLVRSTARTLGLTNMDMPSGAGHDAMHIATLCPAGMIFVPCEHGISHNEIENATPADLAAGARVLVEVLVELANR
jgi:N-carbamoyl-L-amino-acid hydrolase